MARQPKNSNIWEVRGSNCLLRPIRKSQIGDSSTVLTMNSIDWNISCVRVGMVGMRVGIAVMVVVAMLVLVPVPVGSMSVSMPMGPVGPVAIPVVVAIIVRIGVSVMTVTVVLVVSVVEVAVRGREVAFGLRGRGGICNGQETRGEE